MYGRQFVLPLVALYVGLAQAWDFAVSVGDRIEFYNEFGGNIDTAYLPTQKLAALVYDEVHNMLLYSNKQYYNNDAICRYDMTSKEHNCYIKWSRRNIHGLAFDPITETLFFTDLIERSINTFSFKNGSKNNFGGNLLYKLDYGMPNDLAVDSCRGYVYWINKYELRSTIERVRFDGSGRQVVMYAYSQEQFSGQNDIHSIVIDQQMGKLIWKMPWTRANTYTFSADLNGQNGQKKIMWRTGSYLKYPNTNALSKNYLYAVAYAGYPTKHIMKYSKPTLASNVFAKAYDYASFKILEITTASGIAITANYKMDDQFQGISECSQALNSFCVHGTKVPGQFPCKCTPGYTGDRCEVSVCDNYCSNGICGVTEQGHPTCRCEAGYSGERCEVNVCHEYCSNSGTCSLDVDGQPICECQGHYMGPRCEIRAGCINYCFKGNCSFTEQGHPTCRCDAGYSGDRCEINLCRGYCQNDGVCSVNDNNETICQCKTEHTGDRCECSGCLNYCIKGSCSYNDHGLPQCRCDAGYSGDRCEINLCRGYCQNDGVCSVNDNNETVCQCKTEHTGDRCECSGCLNYCIKGSCSYNDHGLPQCRCDAGYSGDRCEINLCRGYCQNDGVCSVNDNNETVCQCNGDYTGDQCEVIIL